MFHYGEFSINIFTGFGNVLHGGFKTIYRVFFEVSNVLIGSIKLNMKRLGAADGGISWSGVRTGVLPFLACGQYFILWDHECFGIKVSIGDIVIGLVPHDVRLLGDVGDGVHLRVVVHHHVVVVGVKWESAMWGINKNYFKVLLWIGKAENCNVLLEINGRILKTCIKPVCNVFVIIVSGYVLWLWSGPGLGSGQGGGYQVSGVPGVVFVKWWAGWRESGVCGCWTFNLMQDNVR